MGIKSFRLKKAPYTSRSVGAFLLLDQGPGSFGDRPNRVVEMVDHGSVQQGIET